MEKKKKIDQGKRYEKIWRKEEKWDFFFFNIKHFFINN